MKHLKVKKKLCMTAKTTELMKYMYKDQQEISLADAYKCLWLLQYNTIQYNGIF